MQSVERLFLVPKLNVLCQIFRNSCSCPGTQPGSGGWSESRNFGRDVCCQAHVFAVGEVLQASGTERSTTRRISGAETPTALYVLFICVLRSRPIAVLEIKSALILAANPARLMRSRHWRE